MMIAFITINSGLVPLIVGLCAQILCCTFEIIGGLRSMLKKKHLVQYSGWNKGTIGRPKIN